MTLTASDIANLDAQLAIATAAIATIKSDVDETTNSIINLGRAYSGAVQLANATMQILLAVGHELGEQYPTT